MEEYNLTEGSIVEVETIGIKDKLLKFKGVFEGYTSLAGSPGLVLKTDNGRKIISAHMIVCVTIIEEGKKEKDEKTIHNLYG